MSNLAVKIAVIESELGWGSKIDDWMVCLSITDAKAFTQEFNSKNTDATAPNWYMIAEGDPIPIELNDKQYEKLKAEKRVWLKALNSL
jgi:hypothetical protein